MEKIRDKKPENDVNLDNEEERQLLKRTFGQKVVEVFNQEETTEKTNATYKEYLKEVRRERNLLETLNIEERSYQDYIFHKAIEDNPEASHFIKNIPGLDTSQPLIAQLLKKNEDGSRELSDETVGNILEFYQSVLKKEEEKLVGDVERIQLSYETNLKKRVEMGQLPQALYENYEKAKQKNGGSIASAIKLFDLRPLEDEEAYFPAGATAFVQFLKTDEMDEKGKIINSKNTEILYKKAFLKQFQEDIMGSLEIMLAHEMTHIIAGKEASFNLLPSETIGTKISEWKRDPEERITIAYREGMTEAIGQMIMDSSPESSSRDLDYYLTNKTGGEQDEREFLASLIEIDKQNQSNDDMAETLERIMLEAYAEEDKDKYVNIFRKRFSHIYSNLEKLVESSLENGEIVMNRIFSTSYTGQYMELAMRERIRERKNI